MPLHLGQPSCPFFSSLGSFPSIQGLGAGGYFSGIVQAASGLCPPNRPCLLFQWGQFL